MPANVTKEQIQKARKVNLYDFLLRHHSDDVVREGESVRYCGNHSVSIKEGYCGYTDFATGDTGNSVDFLINYLGYTLPEAVNALLSGTCNIKAEPSAPMQHSGAGTGQAASGKKQGKPFALPEITAGQSMELSYYLSNIRGISAYVLGDLMADNILYQERSHNNIVFVNPERNFAEIRGSDKDKPFHQVMFDGDPAAFWWFKGNGLYTDATEAFVCESSIDAISLYCIHRTHPKWVHNGLYCSIAGVANQQRIDRIKSGMSAAGLQTILAVDNDEAGEQCRRRNRGCSFIIPRLKDWNEELLDLIRRDAGKNQNLARRLY